MKQYITFSILFILSLFLLIGCANNKQVINQNTNQPIVGGDRDAHGCIGSAGYSWCEAKNKCLRIWEEDCLSQENIRSILASKYNKSTSDIFINITKETAQYAAGSISFTPVRGEGGVFLAAKINDKWQIVYSGNGSIDCVMIKQKYNFPVDMLHGFCD